MKQFIEVPAADRQTTPTASDWPLDVVLATLSRLVNHDHTMVRLRTVDEWTGQSRSGTR